MIGTTQGGHGVRNMYQELANLDEENDDEAEQARAPGITTISDIIQKAMEDKSDSKGICRKGRRKRMTIASSHCVPMGMTTTM